MNKGLSYVTNGSLVVLLFDDVEIMVDRQLEGSGHRLFRRTVFFHVLIAEYTFM